MVQLGQSLADGSDLKRVLGFKYRLLRACEFAIFNSDSTSFLLSRPDFFCFLAIGWRAGVSGGADDPEVATSCADRLARKASDALHWSKHLAAHGEGLDCEHVSHLPFRAMCCEQLNSNPSQAYLNRLFFLSFPSRHSSRVIILFFCQCH